MEDNIILKDQISIEEALNMVEVQTQADGEKNAIEYVEEDKYAIKEDYDAIYHFKRIKECEETIEKKKEIKDRSIAEANEWYQNECKELEELINLSKFRLETYYKEQKAINPKYKLSVPGGSLSVRKTTKYNWVDEEQIIKYLKENHSAAIRVKEELDKTEFKKIYKDGINHETGEIIPGVEVEVVENFSIKTK